MDVISELKLSPLAIFYYEEEEILLWKDFLEQETKTKVIAPTFQRLPSPKNEVATRLINFFMRQCIEIASNLDCDPLVCLIQRSFSICRQTFYSMKNLNPKNIILCTHVLSNVVTFLQRAHSMGILSSDVKLILATLVSTQKSAKTKGSFSSITVSHHYYLVRRKFTE